MTRIDTSSSRPHCFILSGGARELVGFRGPLIKDILAAGYAVSVGATEPTSREEKWFRQQGITFYELPMERTGSNPLSDLRLYLFLRRTFKLHKPDVCLFYTQKPMVYGTIAAYHSGIRNINTLLAGLGYGFSDTRGLKAMVVKQGLKLLHSVAKNKIQNLFFVNPYDHADFKDLNLIGSNTQVTLLPGEGKDFDHYQHKPAPTSKTIRFNLITRILKAKGVYDFVEASKLMKNDHDNVDFDLLGPFDTTPGGVQREEIDQWVSSGLIEYHGLVEDVRPFYESCSATVLPSTYREGLPNVLLEAMASGRPIITYKNPGCNQTIDSPLEIEPGFFQGKNGFLVEPNRVDLLVKAMKLLVNNPELVRDMGNAGRKFGEEKFDVHEINGLILSKIGIASRQSDPAT